jgi:stage II sporulation protein R
VDATDRAGAVGTRARWGGWRRWVQWLALTAGAGCAIALAARAATPAMGGGTVELRVIGASDRPADQALKLQVRDVVLAALAPGLRQARTSAQADAYLRQCLGDVRALATAVAARGGETARVRLGPAPLPARRLGVLRFPATTAPALVITLGAGRGHNWWTVLFPPLALVAVRGDLLVVGPGGAAEPVADLSATQRQQLLAAVGGQTGVPLSSAVGVAGPGGAAAVTVQVRFLAWDLARALPWGGAARWLEQGVAWAFP